MMTFALVRFSAFSFLAFCFIAAQGQMPVTDGLAVHLDANELSLEANRDGVRAWRNRADGIGSFVQSDVDRQPQLVKVGDAHVVRFDGDNDRLRSEGNLTEPTDALTVFLVAAPHQNMGAYRAFLASNAAGQRDYQSGFNIDLGPGPSRRLNWINAEGNGFGRTVDLLDSEFVFGTPHLLTLQVSADDRTCQLRVDGKEAGKRDYVPSPISLEELTIGARFYTNGGEAQQVRGELKGDFAELIIYRRALEPTERDVVEKYLMTRHAKLADDLPSTLDDADQDSVELVMAENPPAIQMLVPGFEVTELPLDLTNVNNVRFRQDGKLITLGYNGDIHLLSDTDGDGIEDVAELFWKNEGSLRGPIGLLVTPEDYKHGQGVFTPSKGKLSLIVDEDGDDRADREIVVATGWNEIRQNVDATGIAMDEAGFLYFGLGTADYSNAYLIDDQGKAAYDIHSERGTVQRVSPDFKQRDTICTGVRFPIAFAFNQHGDLFCSEQEGATWLANGNPFDELLHIQLDRHYGFPPRHPRHNPGVIDEPSVFDYSPQHQSTCGMMFNSPVNGGSVFGPKWWANDAIVSGESRGKIWRTQLAKTSNGYVASTQLLACLQMLTVDSCVSPNGDLVVACHSGPPDWGTGPTGIGKLFRLRMTESEVARPVAAWANSEREMQIAFDRPIKPSTLQGMADKVDIQYGPHVRPGDAFETLVPPYVVVQQQRMASRRRLASHGMTLTGDRRNVLIHTDTLRSNTNYAVSIPYKLTGHGVAEGAHHQHPLMEVGMTLHGVEATFASAGGDSDESNATWSGWLPHLNWQVNDQFTARSATHDVLREAMKQGGMLTLQTKLNLQDMLHPNVQPGSTLDYEWPEENVHLVARSSGPLTLTAGAQQFAAEPLSDGIYEVRTSVPQEQSGGLVITMAVKVAADSPPDCSVAFFTNEDERLRALPLHRFRLPWAPEKDADLESDGQPITTEIEGGSWGAGRRVFHGDAVGCFKCHAIHGAGPTVGPDLSNLIHRDYRSVLRDIRNPSFAINPDHLGQIVVLNSGKVLTGVLQTRHGELLLGDANGNVMKIYREDIDMVEPSDVSVMPKGLDEKLSSDQFRDLMTFLLQPPPHMPLESPLTAPPIRTGSEVAAVLAGSQPLPTEPDELHIVLVAGKKDHGPGEHDYPAWQIQWHELLSGAENLKVDTAWDFPDDKQLTKADVLVFFQKGAWNDDRQKKMDAWFDGGGGAVYIHWAVNGDDRAAGFSRRIGLASKGGSIGYRHGPLSLQVHNTDHPIMRNIEPLNLYDESYWRLTGETDDVTLFATSMEDGEPTPQLWCYDRSAGRVFVSIPGHYSWTFDDPIFRTILLRGIAWTARQPIDRFNELVRPGARMAK